jgi:uncharacterized protein (DUF2141 family)
LNCIQWRFSLKTIPFISIGLGFFFIGSKPAEPLQAILSIQGLKSDQGSVRVALYNKPEGFTEPKKAVHLRSVDAEKGQVTLSLNVPPAKYAVAVFHDANNNGVLDKNAFGIPTEAYGFSNNARGRFGPPDFGDCLIEIGPNTQARIQLR